MVGRARTASPSPPLTRIEPPQGAESRARAEYARGTVSSGRAPLSVGDDGRIVELSGRGPYSAITTRPATSAPGGRLRRSSRRRGRCRGNRTPHCKGVLQELHAVTSADRLRGTMRFLRRRLKQATPIEPKHVARRSEAPVLARTWAEPSWLAWQTLSYSGSAQIKAAGVTHHREDLRSLANRYGVKDHGNSPGVITGIPHPARGR